jgi:hypothetical protein
MYAGHSRLLSRNALSRQFAGAMTVLIEVLDPVAVITIEEGDRK